MDLYAWKAEFLGKRNLSTPTGGLLFTYRMTKEEFEELEQILQSYLSYQLDFKSLNDVAQDNRGFCSAFVFYAAEWWKRRFEGHRWSWAPIVENLGARADGWGQSRRSACIEIGLEQWNINLAGIQGFHYLANIAFNGGLPLKLVSEAQGSIGRMLSRVMRNASGLEETEVLVDWIRSLSSVLPQAYQFDEVFHLLATIAREIIYLKQEARLDTSEGAVEKLDRCIHNWRERLPIAIDDAQTTGLINQLIAEAAGIKQETSSGSGLRAERYLEFDGNGKWQLRSIFDVAQYLDSDQLERQFPNAKIKEQQWLSLSLKRGNSEFASNLRKLAGQERFRIDRKDPGCSGEAAAAEHTLVLSLRDGSSQYSSLVFGSALAEDAPWLFSAEGFDSNAGSFLRQRGGKIPGKFALLAVPDDWSIEAELPECIRERGVLLQPRRKVYTVSGSILVRDPLGPEYSIACGHMEMDYSYELQGSRIWNIFNSPETAFVGAPRIVRTDLETGTLSRFSVSHWKYRGGSWQGSSAGLLGPVSAQYKPQEEVLWRGRMVLLPEGYRTELSSGSSPESGSITLKNSGASGLTTTTPGVRAAIEKVSDTLVVKLSMEEGFDPPEKVDFSLTWPRNPDKASLSLPFPSIGIRIYSGNGSRVLSGSRVSLQEIVGMRIVAFSTGDESGQVALYLEDDGNVRKMRGGDRPLVFSSLSRRVELRLVDFEPELRKALSSANSLNGVARIVILIPRCEPAELLVSQYSKRLEKDRDNATVRFDRTVFASYDCESLDKLAVQALRLDAKGSEPMVLEALRTESVHRGEWLFPAPSLEPGPWLIYPDRDRPYEFQPVLWPIEIGGINKLRDFIAAQGTIKRAIQILDQELRDTEIREALDIMVKEPDNPGWSHVEWVASQVGHLHLSALDLWHGFVRNPPAMAMLAFRVSNITNDFIARFSEELPFFWQIVPLSSLVRSLRLASAQLSMLPDSMRNIVADSHFNGRKQAIISSSPLLGRIILLAKKIADTSGDLSEFHSSLRYHATNVRDKMFKGPDCEYQKLLQRHLEGEWPEHDFQRELEAIKGTPASGLVWNDIRKYRMSVVNAPALFAIQISGLADLGLIMNTSLALRFREVREFDPEWFDMGLLSKMIESLAMREDLREFEK
ncbi:MAG TPA: STY4851/ECs_5259 family protein [Rectinema sp.]|nr:STY4851/ECs_5259 family protein [Rectinema sp.]